MSLERKSQTSGFCVRLRASVPINALVGLYFVGISVPGKGGIRLRRRKLYYFDQMDHSVRPS